MTSGVYQITNTVNSRIYIGSAINVKKRIYEHFRRLAAGNHENARLQNAFHKYGRQAFEWNILVMVAEHSALIPAEQTYIDKLKPFYNICQAAGSRLGVLHSEKTKQLLSKIKTGIRATPATRAKMGRSQTGRRHSLSVKEKIARARAGSGNGMFGKHHTKESLEKIAASSKKRANTPAAKSALARGRGWNRGIPFSEDSRRKMSDAKPKFPVERVCPITGDIKSYPSISSTRADGFNASHVSDCCKGRKKTYRGYIWRSYLADAAP
jgi:group I intron endonuclease